jgi:hypothetical protein
LLLHARVIARLPPGIQQLALLHAKVFAPIVVFFDFHKNLVLFVLVHAHDALDGFLPLSAQNVVPFSLHHEVAFPALHLLLDLNVLAPALALDDVDAFLGIVVHVDSDLLDVLLSLLELETLLLHLFFLLLLQNQTLTLTLCRFGGVFLFPSMFDKLVLPRNFDHLLRLGLALPLDFLTLLHAFHFELLQLLGVHLFLDRELVPGRSHDLFLLIFGFLYKGVLHFSFLLAFNFLLVFLLSQVIHALLIALFHVLPQNNQLVRPLGSLLFLVTLEGSLLDGSLFGASLQRSLTFGLLVCGFLSSNLVLKLSLSTLLLH